MNPILKFLTEMDARALRALWVSAALFGLAASVLAVGVLVIDRAWLSETLSSWLRLLRDAWWAPGVVTGLFTTLAFVGAPQFLLIAATVAVFGPGEGIVLSWVATMISASVGFLLGRIAGAEALQRLGGDLVKRIAGVVKEQGFLATIIVRIVPSGPFILVNMALGASGMRTSWFVGGTGVGSLPKILIIGFAGQSVTQIFSGENLMAIGFLAAAAVVWLVMVFVVRPMLRRARGGVASDGPPG